MAVVAQLVEPRVVISVVVGSSPISRPIFYSALSSSGIASLKNLISNNTCHFWLFFVPVPVLYGGFYLFYPR